MMNGTMVKGKMTLKDAKNQIAVEHNFVTWDAMEQAGYSLSTMELLYRCDDAAELYAKSKWNEAIEAAEDAVFSTIDESRERVSKLKKSN